MDKMIFLDRDGVINKDPGGWTDHGYVTKPDDFKFIPGAAEAIKRLKVDGYKIYIISNQAGISKGYFTKADLDKVNEHILSEVRKAGGDIDAFYYCPHHDVDNCDCRKPKAGLFRKAAEGKEVEWNNIFFIGDSLRDVQAGLEMGVKTVLVLSGKTGPGDTAQWPVKPDYIKKDLLEAVETIPL